MRKFFLNSFSKKQKLPIKSLGSHAVMLSVMTLMFFSASNSQAASFGGALFAIEFQISVCRVVNCFINSGIVTLIGSVAIFFLAVSALIGKMNWTNALMVAVGLIVMKNADDIALRLGLMIPCIDTLINDFIDRVVAVIGTAITPEQQARIAQIKADLTSLLCL